MSWATLVIQLKELFVRTGKALRLTLASCSFRVPFSKYTTSTTESSPPVPGCGGTAYSI